MACVAREVDEVGGEEGGRAVPVIVDRGEDASVALVRFSQPPRVGDRFEHDGLLWEVVRTKDLQRGAVAVPAHRG